MMTRVIGHDPDFLKFYARVVGRAYDPGHDLGHDPGHRPGHDPGHDPGFETNLHLTISKFSEYYGGHELFSGHIFFDFLNLKSI